MSSGYWMLVLHMHLPFVKHPEFDYFLEEQWLFEAITESYIPLLMKLHSLEGDGIDFRLTASITPPLAEMLKDRLLMKRYERYIDTRIELAQKEMKRLSSDDVFQELASFYHGRFFKIKEFFNEFLNRDVLSGFKHFREKGSMEIITCAATHGFLPLLSVNRNAVEAQVRLGVESYKRIFGDAPAGIWLPECAYYVGLDEVLSRNGIRFFFLDTHGVMYSKPAPRNGVYAPIITPSGVYAFGRDVASSKKVWSAMEGYPGDFDYRDFYRDIGYDLDFDYIKPYISPDGVRVFTGIKYHRITGDTEYKEPYEPIKAIGKALIHARHFHREREDQMKRLGRAMDIKPLIVSPYDAELFGHWWFEGVDFLYYLFKEIHRNGAIEPITPSEYISRHPDHQVCLPNASSWGDKGYYDVWLNGSNDWIYRHLHYMADKMVELSGRFRGRATFVEMRILNQAARELLLAQSSDWAFLMTTNTAMEYSRRRTQEHISNFNRLVSMLEGGEVDLDFLQWLEFKDSIFNWLDFGVFGNE